ncbi:tetratricopeptide repeat protein [Elusimicrobiota bacterium]
MDPITNKEDYYYQLGKFYFQKKDYDKAIQELEKGLKINNSSLIILCELGMCYMKMGEYQKAITYFNKVQKIAPFSIPTANSLEKIMKIKSYL